MFIKLGDFVVEVGFIKYIKKFPSGVNVYLKNEETVSIVGVDEEEWDVALAKLFST